MCVPERVGGMLEKFSPCGGGVERMVAASANATTAGACARPSPDIPYVAAGVEHRRAVASALRWSATQRRWCLCGVGASCCCARRE